MFIHSFILFSWTNQLDPRRTNTFKYFSFFSFFFFLLNLINYSLLLLLLLVCHDPFEEEEAIFIIQWIEKNQSPNGSICWKELIHEVECRFNRLRSKNKFKNFWYSRKRRLLLSKHKENPSISTVD